MPKNENSEFTLKDIIPHEILRQLKSAKVNRSEHYLSNASKKLLQFINSHIRW